MLLAMDNKDLHVYAFQMWPHRVTDHRLLPQVGFRFVFLFSFSFVVKKFAAFGQSVREATVVTGRLFASATANTTSCGSLEHEDLLQGVTVSSVDGKTWILACNETTVWVRDADGRAPTRELRGSCCDPQPAVVSTTPTIMASAAPQRFDTPTVVAKTMSTTSASTTTTVATSSSPATFTAAENDKSYSFAFSFLATGVALIAVALIAMCVVVGVACMLARRQSRSDNIVVAGATGNNNTNSRSIYNSFPQAADNEINCELRAP